MHYGYLQFCHTIEATSRIEDDARGYGSGGFNLEQAIRALTPVWIHLQ